MNKYNAGEIRRGIVDAKAFVAKGSTIGKGYIFFRSDTGTPHGRAFQHTLRRLDTRGLGHYRKLTEYMDGRIEYVNRIYAKPQRYMDPEWRSA